MSYRYIDANIPITMHGYEWTHHRYIGIGNEVWACVWCLDCDSHARECPELSPRKV